MNTHLYILDDKGEPLALKIDQAEQWGKFMDSERHVSDETINGVRISTVFLGIDHGFSLEGPPILWESMCFCNGHELDTTMMRCSGSREQAEAMHKRMVEKVRNYKP